MGRSYKAETGKKSFTDPLHTPAEMMQETVVRRVFSQTFDDTILTFNLSPGRDGKNAILTAYKEPIRAHDAKVLEVEALLEVFAAKKKEYNKSLRTLRNWETGWLLLNARPDDLKRYLALKEGMSDFVVRLANVKTPEEHAELESEYATFKELQGRSERLLEAQKMLERCREDKDEDLKVMLQASKDLDAATAAEDALADLVSDDHAAATKQGTSLQDRFPEVVPGMVLVKVHNVDLEDLEFGEVLKQLQKAQKPHALQVQRYDCKQDVLSGTWVTLQEQRVAGRFVADPRVARHHFVESARRGDLADLTRCLRSGEDVNATDATSCTALFHAAANGHLACCATLLDHGASLEFRDRNAETPLLHAARRGNLNVVAWLVDRGASLDAKDKMHRSVVVHAILSGNVALVRLLVELRTSLTGCDKTWRWTPLHYAAYASRSDVVALLLGRRASPYALSAQGWSPLKCAVENQAHACAHMLAEFVFLEPAQNVLPAHGPFASGVWLGAHRAADVRWATDRGFRAILSLYQPGKRDAKHLWLQNQDDDDDDEKAAAADEDALKMDKVKWLAVEVATDDGDATKGSWERLLLHMPHILNFIGMAIKERRELLVHCESGASTSAAVVLMYMLVKRRARLDAAVAHLASHRRQVAVSRSLRNGLGSLMEELDRKKLLRLDERLRNSSVLSIGF